MNRKGLSLILTLLIALTIGACSSSGSDEKTLEGKDFLVTIKTDLGEMKAILYDKTPQHKENFLKLVNEGFYDSLLFHRVMQNFMIQGGDPESKGATPEQRLGSGGPGYTVPAEFVPDYFHEKGALAAARQPDQVNPEKASSGSQFYIVQGQIWPREQLEGTNQGLMIQAFQQLMRDKPESALALEYQEVMTNSPGDNSAIQAKVESTLDKLTEETGITFTMDPERVEIYSTVGGYYPLDENYTVFGKVISGLEVIDKIAAVPTAPGDRPLDDLMMEISVEEVDRKEIAEKYGNPYIQ